MSTTKTTTNTNQYNQGSLNTFNQLQPQTGNLLMQYMQNPMSVVSPFYNLATQQSVKNAGLLGQTQMSNIAGNMAASGFGGTNMPAYMASQLAAQGRATSANQANAFMQGQLGKAGAALGAQQFGLQGGLSYRPLQTGSTQTETQGGLGSWLPQLAGAAIGAATGGMFGGGRFPAPGKMGQNINGNFVSPSFTPQNVPAPNIGSPYFSPWNGIGPQ